MCVGFLANERKNGAPGSVPLIIDLEGNDANHSQVCLSFKMVCWHTRNLGADCIATRKST